MSQAPVTPSPGRRFPAWLGWVLRLVVLSALLAYIFHDLDIQKVAVILRKLPLWAVLAGLALLLTGQVLQAARWKVLLRDPSIRYLDCFAFISMGAALNLVSPSGIISDGTVSYWMGKRNKMVIKSMSALMTSRLIGVGAMAILFLISLPGHMWVFHTLTFTWAPAKAFFLLMAAASLTMAVILARRHKEKVLALVNQTLPVLRSPGSLALAAVLSLGTQLCQFSMLYVGYRTLEIPIGILDIFFFSPIMTFLGMVPMSIGGIGVRESLSIFFFTLLPGVYKEQLLAHAGYGYVLLAGMAVINLLFALLVLGKPGTRKDAA